MRCAKESRYNIICITAHINKGSKVRTKKLSVWYREPCQKNRLSFIAQL